MGVISVQEFEMGMRVILYRGNNVQRHTGNRQLGYAEKHHKEF